MRECESHDLRIDDCFRKRKLRVECERVDLPFLDELQLLANEKIPNGAVVIWPDVKEQRRRRLRARLMPSFSRSHLGLTVAR